MSQSAADLIDSHHGMASRTLVVSAYDNQVWIDSKSGAARVKCEDEGIYVFKGIRKVPITDHGKEATNDQIVGRLANRVFPGLLPSVALLELRSDIISGTGDLDHLLPGVGHGIQYVPNSQPKPVVDFRDVEINRDRFASLAVLNAWCGIGDYRQFIYDSRGMVHAFDHGNAFTSGEKWDAARLSAALPASITSDFLDPSGGKLSGYDLRSAAAPLVSVTLDEICEAIAFARKEWGVPGSDLVALAYWLDDRRSEVLDAVAQLP